MSHLSKVRPSRTPWQHTATQRAHHHRSQRQQRARGKPAPARTAQALQEAQARLRQLESQRPGLVARPQVDIVCVALPRFLVARLGLRAVSRVLRLLAWALGLTPAPGPQTILKWGMRLRIVRLAAARTRKGLPLSPAPFSHGLVWMLDSRLGLGTSKLWAVLACDAPQPQRTPGALALERVHCMGGGVAAAWSGETRAEWLKRLIAQLGRPAAYLKAGGRERQKAVDVLGEPGRSSPCRDDSAHAVAGRRKRVYQEHPSFETFLAGCGRVSGKLKHTILACLTPPKGHTTARFLKGHRLFPWADRVLQRSPPGGAKTGST